ncbi:MAG: PDZ domain-containing protein [Azonexus sp.]|nr:PDZ domain-containing protein [Azonexus sp.]
MQVWRRGNLRDMTVVVGEIPDEKITANRPARNAKPADFSVARLGLMASELTAEQRQAMKLPGGLLVDEIRNPAARGELRQGDVILALIHKRATTEIRSVEQFNKLLAQFERSANITLLIRRGEMQTFVTLKGVN